ncbi:MAG: dihydroorotase [Candidatus Hadarchaeia archaeon]
MEDLNLINARIPIGGRLIEAGISIGDGKIVSVAKRGLLPKANKTEDLGGAILMPGAVDSHVHFRDPGQNEKEDFNTGSKAAVAGGVTTICDMPNTLPPTDTLERFSEKKKIGERKSLVDFGLHAMFPESLEMGKELMEAGAVSLKLYPEITDYTEIKNYDGTDVLISIHPEDPSVVSEMSGTDAEAFIESRPRSAEVSEIEKSLNLTSDLRLHFCHLSTKEALAFIGKVKGKRRISCEVTPHHLLLGLSDLRDMGPIAKMHPPLRTARDRKALLRGLENGLVDIIATDHAPHTYEEKKLNFREAPPGVVGVETSLPLLFTLFRRGRLSLFKMLELLCYAPARIFGLYNENGIPKGTIMPGSDADLVAVDHRREWRIRGEDLHGRSKFTPFQGMKVEGKPFLTVVRGKIMFRNGNVIGGKGHGRFIEAET